MRMSLSSRREAAAGFPYMPSTLTQQPLPAWLGHRPWDAPATPSSQGVRGEHVAVDGVIGGSVYGDGTPSALVQCVLTVGAAVSSVAFDATGSLLVSSDETGRVNTWRQDFTGTWELEQTFEGQ